MPKPASRRRGACAVPDDASDKHGIAPCLMVRGQTLQQIRSVGCAVRSPRAGHAVNPSLGVRWRPRCRRRPRNRPGHRTRQRVGDLIEEQGRSVSHSTGCFFNSAHRPPQLVLARSPSQDPRRHGGRHVSAYRDVLAACPAMVGRARALQPRRRPMLCSPASPPQRQQAKVPSRACDRRRPDQPFAERTASRSDVLVSCKRRAGAPDGAWFIGKWRQPVDPLHNPRCRNSRSAARHYGNAGGLACQAAKTSARLARSASRHSGNRLA